MKEAATDEVSDAEKCLREAEERWEVIDVDAGSPGKSVNGNKRRKVSLSPDGSTTAAGGREPTHPPPHQHTNALRIGSPPLPPPPIQELLTDNAIQIMCSMTGSGENTSFKPFVQVFQLKRLFGRGGQERWKVSSSLSFAADLCAHHMPRCCHQYMPPSPPYYFYRSFSLTVTTLSLER